MGISAYLHPAAMLMLLALGLGVLREGLRLRQARLRGREREPARHTRLARVFVPLLVGGYAAGLASMAWIRGRAVAESVHFPLATAAILGLAAAAGLGIVLGRIESPGLRHVHGLLGALGLLLALVAAVAGMAILP